MDSAVLEVKRLSKAFPGVMALDDVSLSITSGEIVAVVGQNGSGKSTLVKILAGVYRAEPGGEIIIRDERGNVLTGNEAGAHLHFIHQDLGLVALLSTVENLDLSKAPGRRAFLPAKRRQERRRAQQLLSSFGGEFDVELPIGRLTPAERTIVAIARALDGWTDARNVLVLDEPTASLHGDEVTKLFAAVRQVAARGAGVMFISHRLDEVIDLADRVVALRDGRVVADARRGDFDHDQLVRMIAGQDIAAAAARQPVLRPDLVLRVRGLRGPRLHGVDLAVRKGEVVGVTGILGSGREELAAMVFGAETRTAGSVMVGGRDLPPSNPSAAIDAGVAFVPADRRRDGAVMTMSVRENLTLPRLSPLRGRFGAVDRRAERREAWKWIQAVDVRPAAPERPLGLFSGGNQQKIVLAKWLRNEPQLLLLDEPTQGVDVGAKAAIYDLIADAAGRGAAVLISSSELKELTLLCDRVLVLRDGRLAAEVASDSLTEAKLVRESLGVATGETEGQDTNGNAHV